jgi:hypothetical protein
MGLLSARVSSTRMITLSSPTPRLHIHLFALRLRFDAGRVQSSDQNPYSSSDINFPVPKVVVVADSPSDVNYPAPKLIL